MEAYLYFRQHFAEIAFVSLAFVLGCEVSHASPVMAAEQKSEQSKKLTKDYEQILRQADSLKRAGKLKESQSQYKRLLVICCALGDEEKYKRNFLEYKQVTELLEGQLVRETPTWQKPGTGRRVISIFRVMDQEAEYKEMVNLIIRLNWYPGAGYQATATKASFVIHKSGSISDAKISESSGSEKIDDAAMEAITKSIPFAPLPPGMKTDLEISVSFDEQLYCKAIPQPNKWSRSF